MLFHHNFWTASWMRQMNAFPLAFSHPSSSASPKVTLSSLVTHWSFTKNFTSRITLIFYPSVHVWFTTARELKWQREKIWKTIYRSQFRGYYNTLIFCFSISITPFFFFLKVGILMPTAISWHSQYKYGLGETMRHLSTEISTWALLVHESQRSV